MNITLDESNHICIDGVPALLCHSRKQGQAMLETLIRVQKATRAEVRNDVLNFLYERYHG